MLIDDRIALVIALAVIGFMWLAARSLRGDTAPTRRSGNLEAELLVICGRDPARAERLIELEMRRAPAIARAEAIRRALDRHRSDNR
jgi:hypothetical protein